MPGKSRLAVAAVLVAGTLLGAACGVFLMAPAVGTFHDDGVYLVTAQALAEGKGYRIASIPGEPIQNKYPILFPWLLSLIWRLYPEFPDNLVWLRVVPAAAGVAWIGISWVLLRRLGMQRGPRLLALLLIAASPWVVFLSTMLLAETLFAALLTAGLLTVVRIDSGRPGRFDGFVAGALMGAALLTRAAGIAPVTAGFLTLAFRRKWAMCAQYTVGVLIVAGPWFWWVATYASQPTIDAFYSASTYGEWNIVTHFSWREKLDVLRVNALYAARLGQFWGLGGGDLLGMSVSLLCTGLVLRGLWLARTSPVAMLVVLNVGMTLLFVWPPVRYIVPVLPLIVWLAYLGAGKLRPLAAGLAVLLFVSAGFELWTLTNLARARGATSFSSSEGWVFDWYAMKPQIEWINREAPRDAILTTIHDPTYYLFTGRKAMRPFTFDQLGMHYTLHGNAQSPFGTAEEFRRRLAAMKSDYVILTPNDQLEALVTALSQAAPGSLTLAAGDPGSGYVIYKVNRSHLSTE